MPDDNCKEVPLLTPEEIEKLKAFLKDKNADRVHKCCSCPKYMPCNQIHYPGNTQPYPYWTGPHFNQPYTTYC